MKIFHRGHQKTYRIHYMNKFEIQIDGNDFGTPLY